MLIIFEKMSSNDTYDDISDLFDVNAGISVIPAYILIYIFVFAFSAVVGTIGNIMVNVLLLLTNLI